MRRWLVALALFVGALVGYGALAAPLEVASSKAEILYVQGSVKVRSGGGAWKAADAEAELAPGDELTTGKNSAAMLALDNGTNLRVAAQTHIVVVDLRGGGSGKVRLQSGQVWSDVEPTEGSGYEVEGPDAVAAVKGTSFGVEVEEGETVVSVAEGTVQCLAEGVQETLTPMQQLRARRGRHPLRAAFTAEKASAWVRWNLQNRAQILAALRSMGVNPRKLTPAQKRKLREKLQTIYRRKVSQHTPGPLRPPGPRRPPGR
jgi:hypothetical protein